MERNMKETKSAGVEHKEKMPALNSQGEIIVIHPSENPSLPPCGREAASSTQDVGREGQRESQRES